MAWEPRESLVGAVTRTESGPGSCTPGEWVPSGAVVLGWAILGGRCWWRWLGVRAGGAPSLHLCGLCEVPAPLKPVAFSLVKAAHTSCVRQGCTCWAPKGKAGTSQWGLVARSSPSSLGQSLLGRPELFLLSWALWGRNVGMLPSLPMGSTRGAQPVFQASPSPNVGLVHVSPREPVGDLTSSPQRETPRTLRVRLCPRDPSGGTWIAGA